MKNITDSIYWNVHILRVFHVTENINSFQTKQYQGRVMSWGVILSDLPIKKKKIRTTAMH
jgi:hypothetical protein